MTIKQKDIMTTEIEIKKGQESNKLLLIRELSKGLDDIFEEVKIENADAFKMFFGADTKMISKRNFKAKLTIEFTD